MKPKTFKNNFIIQLSLILYSLAFMPASRSAEEMAFVSGVFQRNIPIESLEFLAETGEAKDLLEDLIKISNQNPTEISELLNEKFEMPLYLTSKLLYSSIGEAIILRLAKIIYPIRVPQKNISVPAIRAGVINGIVLGNGKLDLITFLKAYPNKTITVNVPELIKIVNKVESLSDLVRFFSNSPLEGLKESRP